MKTQIDEQKIKPELVFDKQGVRIYKYKKPFYLYYDSYGDIQCIYSSRKSRWRGISKVCKVTYIYRMFCTHQNVIKWFDNSSFWQITINNHGDYTLDTDNSYNIKLLANELEFLTGTKYKNMGNLIECFYNSSLPNMSIDNIALKQIFIRLDELQEITKLTKEEERLELEKKKGQLLEQLFGNQIKAVCEKYGKEAWKYPESSLYQVNGSSYGLSISENQNKMEHLKGELEALGLKVTTTTWGKLYIDKIYIELPDDITVKGDEQ